VATWKKELLAEIEKLHNTPIDDISLESKFLQDNDYQEQWIDAILAARKAGLRLRRLNLRLHQQSRCRRHHPRSPSFERVTTQQPVQFLPISWRPPLGRTRVSVQ
jgi:hypothetical protein